MTILGIDTSNYRTSLCLIDERLNIIHEQNPLLHVAEGEVGLQQSKAVFEHLKKWPELISAIPNPGQIQAIGVSVQPRPVEDSYMPVFKVGEVLAETIAHFLSIPVFPTSHQEGHIAAGEHSIDKRPLEDHFIAVHLSGGTSEVLLCERTQTGYRIEKLGGTLDLHAGQFIDRVGVALGLPFPAGPHLEQLARGEVQDDASRFGLEEDPNSIAIPSYCEEVDFSFSGPTTAALRLIENGYNPSEVARAVEKNIAKTLEKSLLAAMQKVDRKEILLVGGVASNLYIADRLKRRLEHRAVGGKLYIAQFRYATDNAFGVACLAHKQYTRSSKS